MNLRIEPSIFVGPAKGVFNKAGLDYALARIPPDQADATPQMQRIVSSGGSDQLVHVLGGGGFCIAVLNGLKAVGYTGPITLNQQCLDDSVRKAVGSYLKGVYVSANYPIGETSDPDVQLYEKAIVPKVPNAASDITGSGPPMFGTLMGLRTALEGLTGEVTPATITAKIKAMPWSHLPFGGGVHFRCNGQAVPTSPAICTRGALSVQLNDQGFPSASFQPFGDAQF